MSHIGVIQSFPGGNRDLQFLWPYTKRHAGFDAALVTGPRGTWFPADSRVTFFETSRDAYVEGDNLPRKLVDSVECALNIFQQATRVSVEEYDCFHCRDFPREIPSDRMCGIRVGGQIACCESHFFMHWPVSAMRPVWERWLSAAKQLLVEGRYELGTPDAFLALACEVAGIEPCFDAWHGFSKNTIHGTNPNNPKQGDFLPEARQSYRDGCCVFHGVKTSFAYACAVERTVREISRP